MFKTKLFDELTTKELYEILKARARIFITEQKILYVDMDDIDYKSLHVFIEENGQVLAYFRAYLEDEITVKIGRVLTLTHGCGYGARLLVKGLEEVKSKFKCKKIVIDAQKHAEGFYKKFGFVTCSDDFLEEGIIHVKMTKDF